MTRRKVIEDSDGEENAEATPPRPTATGLSDITLTTLVSLDGSRSQEILEQTADPSTSSTELFNRESRAAHESLIEPTPKGPLPEISAHSHSQQQTPNSPTISRLKTKRSKTSVERPKTKKPLKTYSKSSQDIYEFCGGSDGELDAISQIDLGNKAGKRKYEHAKVDQTASRQGSQREDVTKMPTTSSSGYTELLSIQSNANEISWAPEKEASPLNIMPPPTSKSTSFSQSQRSQTDKKLVIADLAPFESTPNKVFPLTGENFSDTHPADRRSAPERPLCGKADDERSSSPLQSVKAQTLRSNETMKDSEPQQTKDQAPNSSASEIMHNKIISVERTDPLKGFPEELTSALDPNVHSKVNPVVLLPEPAAIEETQDELSFSASNAFSNHSAEPVKVSKRKRDINDETVDELGPDNDAIGLPKECYQPRPSKRRSGGGDGEIVVPTDFSKRPEAMSKGKRKTKRHKTTAFQELLPQDEDEDDEVTVVPDPRFKIPEKKPPKAPRREAQPDLEQDDNTERIQPKAQPEQNQAAKSTSAKRRGRPKKVTTNLPEDIVADDAQADHDQEDTEAEEHVTAATAKETQKGAKTKEIRAPTNAERGNNKDGSPAAEDDSEDVRPNILNEIPGNAMAAAKSLAETSPVKDNNVPPETPRKSTTPAPKGPDKHSPLSSGKVAYRVGLSKRARIAPLLRIVRK